MSQTDAVNLHNELNRLSSAIERRDDFHRFLEQALAPRQVPGEVLIQDGSIHINVLGHDIAATPRPVKVGDNFAIEYEFRVAFQGESIPIWQVYLWERGVLTEAPDTDSARLCDYNNNYVKQVLVVAVTNALLHSPVFIPSTTSAAS